MPTITCPCGYVHDLTPIPDVGWRTVRDQDFDQWLDAVHRAWFHRDDYNDDQLIAFWTLIAEAQGQLYECPDCGRIMWKRQGETEFRIFTPQPKPTNSSPDTSLLF